MNLHDDHRHPEPLDPALDGLMSRLDALGRADGDAAGDGLEERLNRAVGGVFVPEPIAFRPASRVWWRSGVLRIAAAAGMACGVGMLLYSQSRSAAPGVSVEPVSVAMVEQRIEGLLALTDGADEFGDEIASIELWADALGSDSDSGWLGTDLGDLGFGEGAL